MSGRLAVIGLGPGDDAYLTAEARAEIAGAEIFYGYAPYLARLALRGDQTAHASDNRAELSRAEAALTAAAAGARVAVVSGGDPGVFAMAAAVCEAIDHGPAAWREMEIAAGESRPPLAIGPGAADLGRFPGPRHPGDFRPRGRPAG